MCILFMSGTPSGSKNADMIKIRIEMGSHWTWVGPKSNERVLIRREDTQRDT